VETEFGFHIFRRRAPPPEGVVSGSRIIIGHDDAPWLNAFLSLHPVPARSRVEALTLANNLYQRVRDNPEAFAKVARESSEHQDALRDGDLGEWSTRESTPYRQAIEILQGLDVGGVAAPMDSLFGYQIIQRTSNRPRTRYAVSRISIDFSSAAMNPTTRSHSDAHELAVRLAHAVAADPSQFPKLAEEYPFVGADSWVEGRGDARLERAVAPLAIGNIAAEPVELATSYEIVKRLAPTPAEPSAWEFELPMPERPDVEGFVTAGMTAPYASAGREAARALVLSGDSAAQLVSLHQLDDQLQRAPSADRRLSIYRESQNSVAVLLGATRYQRYRLLVDEYFEKVLLENGQP